MNFIETERLILRSWKKSDLEPFKNMNKDKNVMQYSGNILSDEESTNYYNKIIAHFIWHGFGLFAVEIKSTNTFIGYIGISIPPHDFWPMNRPCVEVGWRLMFGYWGNDMLPKELKLL